MFTAAALLCSALLYRSVEEKVLLDVLGDLHAAQKLLCTPS